jgi:ParB/RepB/Spo0J family partition protein
MENAQIYLIPVSKIRIPEDILRKALNSKKNEAAWNSFKQSIENTGLIHPIVVSVIDDDDQYGFALIDGMQRLTACTEIDPEYQIKAIVADPASRDDSMEMSIVSNVHRFATAKSDLARQIKKWFESGMTVKAVAQKLSMTEQTVLKIVSLNQLDPEVLKMVDNGSIPVVNAVLLVNAQNGIYGLDDTQFAEMVKKAQTLDQVNLKTEIDKVKTANRLSGQSVEEIARKVFIPVERFDQELLEEIRARYTALINDAAAFGDPIGDCDQAVHDIFCQIYHTTRKEIDDQRAAFDKEKNEALDKAKKRIARESEKSEKTEKTEKVEKAEKAGK